MKLIDKDALVAEIERRVEEYRTYPDYQIDSNYMELCDILSFIDTLEVKEVDYTPMDNDFERDAVNFCFDNALNTTPRIAKTIAKHFFELGVRKKKEEKYEVPSVSKIEDVSVTSRMAMIDDDLKPIAEFILDYAGWNLHKDEWNHPVLEVPLFRVLDALIQRGKPYCGKN